MERKLDVVVRKLAEHFECEERVMKEAGYPGFEEHSRIHQALLDRAEKRLEAYEQGDANQTTLFAFMMKEIMINHMIEEDMKYYPYIS
ncbi:MAG: hypothetical protein EOM54_07430 [Clostridia bacterium]|nr:hypothetical protein [Clostridia bacterium]